jgi:broad specificity polyphosphatase/5'/3'-nucleotidase SurE
MTDFNREKMSELLKQVGEMRSRKGERQKRLLEINVPEIGTEVRLCMRFAIRCINVYILNVRSNVSEKKNQKHYLQKSQNIFSALINIIYTN